MQIALFEPEIPPNTGNIMRLCANTGTRLHLVRPLGFDLDEKKLRRAGMDYRDFATVALHDNYAAFVEAIQPSRLLACTTRGGRLYSEIEYDNDDVLLFGPESRGLPERILNSLPRSRQLRIPMKESSRSLNLSNATAVVLYEALRQLGFSGLR